MNSDKIVYLKVNNDHQIWIIKDVKLGYKYFGIYSKELKGGNQNGRKHKHRKLEG